MQSRSLAAKRADVVAKVAPELPEILGDGYRAAFLAYAGGRPMSGGYRRDALDFAEHVLIAGGPRRSGGAARADVLVAGPLGFPPAGPGHPADPCGARRPRGEVNAVNALALVLNIAALVSAVLLITTAVSAGSRRPSAGPFPGVHDLYEAAFLNGGPARVVDTALTALYADGRVLIGGPGIISVQRPQASDPVERAVLHELSAAPSGALHVIREAAMRHPAVQEIGDGLAQRGLLVPPAANRGVWRWGLVQGVSCLVAFPVSIVLTVLQYATHGASFDLPAPFVVKMLPAIVVGGISGLVVASVAARRITGRAAGPRRGSGPPTPRRPTRPTWSPCGGCARCRTRRSGPS